MINKQTVINFLKDLWQKKEPCNPLPKSVENKLVNDVINEGNYHLQSRLKS